MKSTRITAIQAAHRRALAAGHAGAFLTVNLPTRFHRSDATPEQAHNFLKATWRQTRAHMVRQGVHTYGVRIAQPHSDGIPHWHVLVWAPSREHLVQMARFLRSYLAQGSDGSRVGCGEVNVQQFEAGSCAAAYFAERCEQICADVLLSKWRAAWGIGASSAFGTQRSGS